MKDLVKLRHLHLRDLTPYLRASAIQDQLVRTHLDHKAAQSKSTAPGPVLLTFQTPPTYTCGRREVGALSPSQIAHLRADGKAEFFEALRGGQTTFHGPGQLTAYLILSLQEHGLDTRSHVKLLENSVIGTCKSYGLTTQTTENPGVWIGHQPDDRKIASVGVHLRRHIASHGIGLNISTDLSWFDRIVACGLVGKKTTSIEKELKTLHSNADLLQESSQHRIEVTSALPEEHRNVISQPRTSIQPWEVAADLAQKVAAGLAGIDREDVRNIDENNVWPANC